MNRGPKVNNCPRCKQEVKVMSPNKKNVAGTLYHRVCPLTDKQVARRGDGA